MAPSNLQGLNIVHPPTPANPYLSDADLLSVPPFPDFNSQLDLWTNLNFQSDEPLVSSRPRRGSEKDRRGSGHADASDDEGDRYNDDDDDEHNRSGIAEAHSHENVVMGTVLPPTGIVHSAPRPNNPGQLPPFDLNTLLAGFGIDPFVQGIAPTPNPAATAMQQVAPSTIAQLLSLHASSLFSGHAGSQQHIPSPQSVPAHSPAQPSVSASTPASTSTTSTNKRARTSRGSISSVTESDQAAEAAEDKASANPLNPAEDKRRRNTAASARFRLKKKEREAALEHKAKELEVRVGELEKECEALRRENGWLKGLVVGGSYGQCRSKA
ncbi:uncharacterized protein BXZ73DRAFT_90409 [Epithele typhae]|uniref:uncharacterized protein n=1 Tax=Epithele typhae TaxID=378194 RepID=UPI0020078C4A|nr:uncharacterized protein BXZ73DRAFT_90409 [Epithele typhae]KAH9929558.1 hypothetical protein BXZ73DRAFT_90409 [Epithele typhae]